MLNEKMVLLVMKNWIGEWEVINRRQGKNQIIKSAIYNLQCFVALTACPPVLWRGISMK